MEEQVPNPQSLVLHVKDGSPQFFSTVLQSGIEVSAEPGDTIGIFLERLPGFTNEYILQEVQTIFLNGTATDDLQTPLSGENPTLAITTAMPGLAGAIFRKNSPHAPLRTTSAASAESAAQQTPSHVTLKIFTTIAKDKGTLLLQKGVNVKGNILGTFFQYRPSLLSHIRTITLDGSRVTEDELLTTLKTNETIHLSILT